MLVGSSQSPLSVSDFRNDIFGPYDDEIFLFFSFAFLSIFVCATSGTNVNDIRRIDFKNLRYPWDEPDESDKTTWRWTQLSLQSKVLLIVLAKEHGVDERDERGPEDRRNCRRHVVVPNANPKAISGQFLPKQTCPA
jgi:hypothetical protein